MRRALNVSELYSMEMKRMCTGNCLAKIQFFHRKEIQLGPKVFFHEFLTKSSSLKFSDQCLIIQYSEGYGYQVAKLLLHGSIELSWFFWKCLVYSNSTWKILILICYDGSTHVFVEWSILLWLLTDLLPDPWSFLSSVEPFVGCTCAKRSIIFHFTILRSVNDPVEVVESRF